VAANNANTQRHVSNATSAILRDRQVNDLDVPAASFSGSAGAIQPLRNP
jgi:hypothetical protein